MKILIAPDSYKGSLTALQVAATIKSAFCEEIKNAQVRIIPMADGGEGTLDAILTVTEGAIIKTKVRGPMGAHVESCYGLIKDTKTAIIETASVVGLSMVQPDKRSPMLTTTYGMGEVILQAIQNGAKDFIIGLGGSATNDGGLGMLMALGGKFLNRDGKQVEPIAASLSEIESIDLSGLHPALNMCNFEIACDVENPLCGEFGATFIFGPQKGATKIQLVELDKGLERFSDLVENELGHKLREIPGAGAAGGLGFAFLVLGGKIKSGAEFLAEALNLEEEIKDSDWVVTGEGQSDGQTIYGKAPYHVASLAKKHGVKAILISGSLGDGFEKLLQHFVSCHAIVNRPMTLEEAIKDAEANLYGCARNIARLIAHSTY